MKLSLIIYDMQMAVSALSAFVCLWGLTEFGSCLWDIVKYNQKKSLPPMCPYYAGASVVCIAGLLSAFARANTLGFMNLGQIIAGLAYAAGSIVLTMCIGLGIWTKNKPEQPAVGRPLTQVVPSERTQTLGRVFSMMLIIILSFVLVGLVRVMNGG